MSREEHIARQEAQRDPADADTPTEALQAEHDRLSDEINALYWRFSRTASSKVGPPDCPEKYARRAAIYAELMTRKRIQPEDEAEEDEDYDEFDESMDGDHESALASVYGPNE